MKDKFKKSDLTQEVEGTLEEVVVWKKNLPSEQVERIYSKVKVFHTGLPVTFFSKLALLMGIFIVVGIIIGSLI